MKGSNFTLLSICIAYVIDVVYGVFMRVEKHLLIIRPLEYNPYLTPVMSFHLVSHLQMVVIPQVQIYIIILEHEID